jgi:hypothetical protein
VVLSFDPGDVANAGRLAAFLAAYPTAASASLVGPFSSQLDNGGDTVRLQRPDAPPPLFISHLLEDEVTYDDVAPWPTEADGAGASLHRRETNLWGDAAASWEALPPSPGTVEFATVAAQVAGRWVFYNNSAFDGHDPLAGVSDDAAIAVDKQALLPGQTASFVNYTSYSGGINGIMVDIESLANAAGLDKATDFQFKVGNGNDPAGWASAPLPSSLTVRPGMGENGSYRVTLIWAGGAIENQWLQVAVLATPNTGLSQPDVFYFGNAVGEAGN